MVVEGKLTHSELPGRGEKQDLLGRQTPLSSGEGDWTASLSQRLHCVRTKEFNLTGKTAFKVHLNRLLESYRYAEYHCRQMGTFGLPESWSFSIKMVFP